MVPSSLVKRKIILIVQLHFKRIQYYKNLCYVLKNWPWIVMIISIFMMVHILSAIIRYVYIFFLSFFFSFSFIASKFNKVQSWIKSLFDWIFWDRNQKVHFRFLISSYLNCLGMWKKWIEKVFLFMNVVGLNREEKKTKTQLCTLKIIKI